MMNMNEFEIRVGLIKGRHEMPVYNYIFDEPIEDVTDFDGIEEHILDFIKTEVGIHTTCFGQAVNAVTAEDAHVWAGDKRLTVYATGLTAVTAALIRVCLMYGVNLTLMHYDTACGLYKPQVIW